MANMESKTSRPKKHRKELTPEAREEYMTGLAVDLAEQKLRDGTASSQIICHYLKLASPTTRVEREILEEQKKLIMAKTSSIESAQRADTKYEEAIEAMRRYSGNLNQPTEEVEVM